MKNRTIYIAPSILSADLAHLEKDIAAAEKAGADMIHIDIMDGHFVPNISFGPSMVKAVNGMTGLPLDVHLMISDPQAYLEQFARAGADYLTVHAEACTHLHRALEEIRALDVKPGVSLNPGTSLDVIGEMWGYLDLLLLMTVNPGFGGQRFIESVVPKITRARTYIDDTGLDLIISVDGGINDETIPRVLEAGATHLVMGAYVFGSEDIGKTLEKVHGYVRKFT